MNDFIVYSIILVLIVPLVIVALAEIVNFVKEVGVVKIACFCALGVVAHHFITSNHSFSDSDNYTLEYRKHLRLDSDPYVNIRNMYNQGIINIKEGVNITGLRIEMASVIPLVVDAYKTVVGEDYSPTITSGNDSYAHSENSKHYENLALDWRTRDITTAQAKQVAKLIEKKLSGFGRYWVDFEGTHIHIHYNKIKSKEKYEDLIIETALKHQVEIPLVMAVVHRESQFDSKAKSYAGARGLMQLMPGTASDLGVTDPYDPVENVDGGTRYLKKMLKRYSGNVELALAAYNSGPGNIDKAVQLSGTDDWNIVKNNLVTEERNQKQTIDYVEYVTNYKKLYQFIYGNDA